MALRFLRDLDDTANRFETVEVAYLDGYPFGDRLLEGVIFELRVSPDRSGLTASVIPSCAAYFEDLNGPKWLAEAVKYALQNDVFSGSTERGKDFTVVLHDDSKPHAKHAWNCPPEIVIDGKTVRG